MRNFIEDHKAQMTIVAILMVFIALLVYVNIVPVMNNIIVNATEGPNATMTEGPNATITDESVILLLRLTPLLIMLAIIASIFVYTQPTYGGG